MLDVSSACTVGAFQFRPLGLIQIGMQVQVGDKRWFKGAKKDAMGTFDSFIVA